MVPLSRTTLSPTDTKPPSEPRLTECVRRVCRRSGPRAGLLVLLVTVCASSSSLAGAQEESPPLVTDRPDQTESTAIVPKGSVQLEMGVKQDADELARAEEVTDTFGSALLRIGLARKVELRLGWNGFGARDQRKGAVSKRRQGIRDANLGAKIHLAPEKGRRPGIAVIPGVSVPVGNEELTSGGVDPGVLVAFNHTISDRVGLGYNGGLVFESNEPTGGDRRTLSTWVYSIASGITLSETLGTFVEVFGSTPASASGSTAVSFDTGLVWLARPNLQFDASAGLGLTDSATDWFVSVGLTVRLPR